MTDDDLILDDAIIDAMLEKAESVVADVFREFTISHVVAAFSGGDDSIVSTHWAMNRFRDCVVMTADTKIGIEAARQHSRDVCQKFNFPHIIVSPEPEGPPKGWKEEWINGGTSYEEFVLNHGFPGPGQHHRMYQRLKQRAFRKIKPQFGKRPKKSRILVVSGIRADESAIRAGYKRAYQEESSECFVWCNPFYHCSATDFEAYRQEFGLPRNPVKRKCGISGECCCGAFASDGERLAYREVDPAFADYLDALENRVMQRFPWGWGEKPPHWWQDVKAGQLFLFNDDDRAMFMPACVGCNRKNRAAQAG